MNQETLTLNAINLKTFKNDLNELVDLGAVINAATTGTTGMQIKELTAITDILEIKLGELRKSFQKLETQFADYNGEKIETAA